MLRIKQGGVVALLAASAILAACGGGGGGSSSSSETTSTSGTASSTSSTGSSETSSTASSATSSAASSASSTVSASSSSASSTTISSLGATGWASYYSSSSSVTTGGNGAASGKIYTVSTRAGLIQALHGNSATISSDGSFSGTLDSSAKIIYISGEISLNQNSSGTELTADDYVKGSCAYSNYGYTTAAAMWSDYETAYNPQTVVPSSSATISGNPESARACAAALQKQVVMLYVPSNTSIIGIGSSAKITHGNLVLGTNSANVSNIVIRNVTFEDSFDFFPEWDPTDSTTGRWNSAYDLISVMYATHVWIDHNEFSDGSRTDDLYPSVWSGTASDNTDYATNEVYKFMHHDGLVDVTKAANYVTLSYNYFHDHDKSFLIGGTDTANLSAEHPGVLNVTFHHNYFLNLKQRQPRVRYGMVHVYNNYYANSTSNSVYTWSAGWVAGQGAKLYVENNAVVSSTATTSTLYTGSSSSSKVASCASLSGMTSTYCAAYAYLTGNTLNGSTVDLSGVSTTNVTWTSTPWPSVSSPTTAISATPSSYYSYTLESTPTTVPTDVGVGKL